MSGTQTGNNITSAYTLSKASSENYSITETGVPYNPLNFSISETGSTTSTTTETGNTITGTYNRTTTGTDSYAMSETGNEWGGTYSETVTGTETYTVSETGNPANQTYSRSTTGGGRYTRTLTGPGATLPSGSGYTSYNLTETADARAGQLSQSGTDYDRYNYLLERFNNVANTGSGNDPGNMNFSPVGQPFVDPDPPGDPQSFSSNILIAREYADYCRSCSQRDQSVKYSQASASKWQWLQQAHPLQYAFDLQQAQGAQAQPDAQSAYGARPAPNRPIDIRESPQLIDPAIARSQLSPGDAIFLDLLQLFGPQMGNTGLVWNGIVVGGSLSLARPIEIAPPYSPLANGNVGTANPGAAANTIVTRGSGATPQRSTPNSVYEQLAPNGQVMRRSYYDARGNLFSREEYIQTADHNVTIGGSRYNLRNTPHQHELRAFTAPNGATYYKWQIRIIDQNGQPITGWVDAGPN